MPRSQPVKVKDNDYNATFALLYSLTLIFNVLFAGLPMSIEMKNNTYLRGQFYYQVIFTVIASYTVLVNLLTE